MVLTDPGLKKVYGKYTHAALKGQDYRKIFRDVKADVRDAIKDGSFSQDLAGGGAAPAESADDDYEPSVVDVAEVVKIEDGEFQDWTSSKGTRLHARLVAVEGDTTFVFETKSGKTIRTTADKLSDETVKRARELAAEN